MAPLDRRPLGLVGRDPRAGGELFKGGDQRLAFFLDPSFESLLLGVHKKDPLRNPGIDGAELDPAVSGKSRVRHEAGCGPRRLRVPRMEKGADLREQTIDEPHGLGSPGQPMKTSLQQKKAGMSGLGRSAKL